jgi:MFS family permease
VSHRQDAPTTTKPRATSRIFYGYWIVAFGLLCLTMCIGCGSFVYSLFVHPLQAEFFWSRGQIMVGFTIFWVMMGIGSPIVGRILDRHGARRAISLGALVMGIGFVLLSMTNTLPFFYLGYIFVGLGAAGIGPVSTSAVASNWFRRKRGMALGITAAGIGTGGVIMAPIVGYLLQAYDWRTAYFAMAIIVWVAIIPLALVIVRTRPGDVGLYPDGDSAPADAEQGDTARTPAVWGLTLAQAVRTAPFWLIAVSYLLSNGCVMAGLQSQGPNLDDIGFPTATAAAALSATGFGSGVGKLFFGWLCDYVKPRLVSAIGLTLQCLGILVLLQVRAESPMTMVWGAALLMGFGAGSWLPTMSLLVSRSFGLAFYGAVFGAINLAQSIGTATGPLLAGMMFDQMGTYRWAFILFAALYAIAIPAVLFVRRPKLSETQDEAAHMGSPIIEPSS